MVFTSGCAKNNGGMDFKGEPSKVALAPCLFSHSLMLGCAKTQNLPKKPPINRHRSILLHFKIQTLNYC